MLSVNIEFFPYPFIIGLVILLVILPFLRRRKISRFNLFFFSLFWVYLLILIGATLFPMPIGLPGSSQPPSYIFSQVNLIPFDYSQFSNLSPLHIFIREIVANIFLTLPFAFLISFLVRLKPGNVIWIGLAVGLGIETAQLVMNLILAVSYRGVDINDSLWNAVGVWLGFGLFWLFARFILALAGRQENDQTGVFARIHAIARRTQPGKVV